MKTILIPLLLIVYGSHILIAQEIKGKVINATQSAISNASVTLKLSNKNIILDYKRSDNNGEFKLKVNPTYNFEELYLEVSHLGYKRSNIRLLKKQHVYEIIMESAELSIDEIIIKNKPKIKQLKDTISFYVKGFARDEDRSIGDVLKRMPGIAVDDDGQVRFNNKAISNFYIDNDDLLGAKYGIGTKAIPLNMVENVQVYSNHEHIKALKDQFGTDKVSINLEVKEDAKLKLMGQTKLAAGIAKRYDPESNAILLNKHYKMLNVIKANNIGDELAGEHKNLTATGHMQPKEILSGSIISPPYIHKRRYFDNHSATVNANNYFKFKNDFNLRTTIGYFIDNNQFTFRGNNTYFLAKDTVSFREIQDTDNRSQGLMFELNVERNLASFFLKNNLVLNLNSGKGLADITDNEHYFDQILTTKPFTIANVFNYITTDRLHNKWEFEWKHLTANTPQRLSLTSEVDQFYGPKDRIRTEQQANVFRLTNTLTSRYRRTKDDFRQVYSFNINQDYKNLESNLNIPIASAFMPRANSIGNAINWNEFGFLTRASYIFRKGKWDYSLELPLRGSLIYFEDIFSSLKKHRSLIFFEPSFSLKYRVNPQDAILLNYIHKNSINDISTLFSNFILVNYRTLMHNTHIDIWNESDQHFILDYAIKRPMSMFFANVAASYNIKNRQSLTDMTFDAANMLELGRVFLANKVHSFNTNIALSKYIFFLGATFSLKPAYSYMKYKNVLNKEVYTVHTDITGITADLDFQILKKVNFAYKLKLNHFKNSFWLQENRVKRMSSNIQYDNSLKTTYSPKTYLHLNITMQSYDIIQKDAQDLTLYFVDIGARLKVKPWKMDLALIGRNLANQRNLKTYKLEHTGESRNSYGLNPRMVILSATFTF